MNLRELGAIDLQSKIQQKKVNQNFGLSLFLYYLNLKWNYQYFKELSNQNIRDNLYKNQFSQIEDLTTPFGIINNGLNQQEYEVDTEGNLWTNVE